MKYFSAIMVTVCKCLDARGCIAYLFIETPIGASLYLSRFRWFDHFRSLAETLLVLLCGKSRRGDFQIRRKSRRNRMRTKLREIKEGMRHRWHVSIPDTGKWLGQIVAGSFAYRAVPTNSAAIGAFRRHVTVLWHRQLCGAVSGRGWSDRG